ncbi:MAG TPA: FtsX-like permease family protein [Candidatus Eisenbacteria bacterium]|nr:FtsX-like permease family protein [Candidatus Eisenbacteria bacterium]
MFNWFSQIASVVKFGLLSIPQRRGSVTAALFGIVGVVAVLVGVLSMAVGFKRTMENSSSPDAAIVLRSGANDEMSSGLQREETRLLSEAPGIASGPEGPLASAELFVIINLPKRSTGTDANVPLRGVEPAAFNVREKFKLLQGRRFERGKNEVIVGIGAAQEFAGLDVGNKFHVGRNDWEVVGTFSAGGGTAESEIWTDAAVLQTAYHRGNSFQSVYARLTAPDAFFQFSNSVASDPRLSMRVMRQSDFYAEQATLLNTLITTLGYLVAFLMAIGAIFGALNTMYNSVSARTREIATLRALGFGSGAVVVSVMLESLAVALAGGAIGAAIAYVAFNGFHTSTVNWQSFSQVTFAFHVTPQLVIQGIIWATLIGLIGGFFPAIRAARLPIAAALREL